MFCGRFSVSLPMHSVIWDLVQSTVALGHINLHW